MYTRLSGPCCRPRLVLSYQRVQSSIPDYPVLASVLVLSSFLCKSRVHHTRLYGPGCCPRLFLTHTVGESRVLKTRLSGPGWCALLVIPQKLVQSSIPDFLVLVLSPFLSKSRAHHISNWVLTTVLVLSFFIGKAGAHQTRLASLGCPPRLVFSHRKVFSSPDQTTWPWLLSSSYHLSKISLELTRPGCLVLATVIVLSSLID